MSRTRLSISVVRQDNKDEVLATVQIAGTASLDDLRREIEAKLKPDQRTSVQMLLDDNFLLGPGILQEHGLKNGAIVGLIRKRGVVVTGSADHAAITWCAKSGKITNMLKGHADVVNSAAFSPDNRLIATGSADKKTMLWRHDDGERIATLEEHGGEVATTVFSPDGTLLLTGSLDKTAKLWRLPSGLSASPSADGTDKDRKPEVVMTFIGHEDGVSSVDFASPGTFLATGSFDGTAKVWGVKDGACWATMTGHGAAVRGVGFSPDHKLLVTASQDMTAKVWNSANGAERFTLRGHNGFVTAASFSPDGRFIVTVSQDKLAKVWCPKSGQCVHTLEGHSLGLYAARFAQNGRFIVTGSSDGTAKVWSLVDDKFECSLTLQGHKEGVRSAACSSMWSY